MEYNLQKLITPKIPAFQNRRSYPYLRSDPNVNIISPGIGQPINNFQFFVPIYVTKNCLNTEKIESSDSNNLVGGSSETNEISDQNPAIKLPESKHNSSVENKIDTTPAFQPMVVDPNPDSYIENKHAEKRRFVSDNVKEAFQHPFVKTGRFEIKSPPKSDDIKPTSLSHKFNVVKKK